MLARYRVEMVDASGIFPSPENDAIYGEINLDNDPAMPALIDSIKRLGLEEPIICTRDKYILSGHRRFYACRELGWTRVPVRFANVSRDGSADYHRLLAQYNPQRVKSVASLLSEKFLQSDEYQHEGSFLERQYQKSDVNAEFITVDGTKGVDPIGRPKGRTLLSVVRKMLRGANFDDAALEKAAEAFVAKMCEGSFPHLKEYIERVEGKVPDVVHGDGNVRVDINAAPAFFRRRTRDSGLG